MHKKVAKKYMSRLLCSHLQKALSSARLNLSEIQGMTSRAISLIDDSDYREEVYKEAGDMIYTYQTTLDNMATQMDTLAYIVDKIAFTAAADDLKPTLRKQLDKALRGEEI